MSQSLDYQNPKHAPEPRGGSISLAKKTMSVFSTFLGLAAVYLFFWGLTSWYGHDTFATRGTTELMLQQSVIVGIGAIGMTLVIITGGIDLSVASIIAMVMVVIAKLIEYGEQTEVIEFLSRYHLGDGTQLYAGVAPTLAAIAGVGAGALCGFITGLLITQLRLMPFIITLGMMGALRGGAKGLADEHPIYPSSVGWIKPLVRNLSKENAWMLLPPGVWIMLVLALLTALMLRYTRFGRHIFAVGSNEQTARLCGVRVNAVKVMVYSLAGVFAGIAGLMFVSKLRGGDPTGAVGMELNIIAAVVIGGASLSGGRGGVLGSIVGTLIINVVSFGCQKMEWNNWVQEMVTGLIIIVAVFLDRIRQGKAA